MRSTKRILITGGEGQLGHDCRQVFTGKHEVLALGSSGLDITDADAVESCLTDFSPDIIINCAAFTKVDACETEVEKARLVNALGPENLAAALSHRAGLLVHISTDYVFDGSKSPPAGYGENEPAHPLTEYGRSKLAGEEAVRRILDRHLIIRTAWLYGISGHNFLKTILRLVRQNREAPLRVVNDQHGTPTWSWRLALQIEKLVASQQTGTFHASADGNTTWYETARLFLETMQVPHRLIPCTTAEYPTPAKRPGNSILENNRLNRSNLSIMTPWQEDIRQFVAEYREQLLKEQAIE